MDTVTIDGYQRTIKNLREKLKESEDELATISIPVDKGGVELSSAYSKIVGARKALDNAHSLLEMARSLFSDDAEGQTEIEE